jgi:hypothetical protein
MKRVLFSLLLLSSFCFSACSSWNYGYTQRKALNRYLPVGEKSSDLGNRRLRYNEGHHTATPLSAFIRERVAPDFIYEYTVDNKDGIRLYYISVDSVYDFLESKKNHPRSSALVSVRPLSEEEKQLAAKLNAGAR